MGGLRGGNFLHRKDLLQLKSPDRKRKVTLTDNWYTLFQSERQIFDKVIIDSNRPLQMNTMCRLNGSRTLPSIHFFRPHEHSMPGGRGASLSLGSYLGLRSDLQPSVSIRAPNRCP